MNLPTVKPFELSHYVDRNELKFVTTGEMKIEFFCSTGLIGKFFINPEGKLDFEGELTESAEEFVDLCKRLWLEPSAEVSPADLASLERTGKPFNIEAPEASDLQNAVMRFPLPEPAEGQTHWKVGDRMYCAHCGKQVSWKVGEMPCVDECACQETREVSPDPNEHIRRKQLLEDKPRLDVNDYLLPEQKPKSNEEFVDDLLSPEQKSALRDKIF